MPRFGDGPRADWFTIAAILVSGAGGLLAAYLLAGLAGLLS